MDPISIVWSPPDGHSRRALFKRRPRGLIPYLAIMALLVAPETMRQTVTGAEPGGCILRCARFALKAAELRLSPLAVAAVPAATWAEHSRCRHNSIGARPGQCFLVAAVRLFWQPEQWLREHHITVTGRDPADRADSRIARRPDRDGRRYFPQPADILWAGKMPQDFRDRGGVHLTEFGGGAVGNFSSVQQLPSELRFWPAPCSSGRGGKLARLVAAPRAGCFQALAIVRNRSIGASVKMKLGVVILAAAKEPDRRQQR